LFEKAFDGAFEIRPLQMRLQVFQLYGIRVVILQPKKEESDRGGLEDSAAEGYPAADVKV
jgi:hypothetical protein